MQEADVARDMGAMVGDYLRRAGCAVNVVQEDSLSNICSESDGFGSDWFVSIHCNAASSPEAEGFEVWICDPPSEGALRLAEAIRSQIAATFPTLIDRGVKRGGLYVTRYTECPAALVETAFISNPTEEAMLADPAFLDGYARAVARGVTDAASGASIG